MQLKKSQESLSEEPTGKEIEVLNVWQTPGPGYDPYGLRPKEFKIVRLECGCMALCKMDSAPEYIAHEAEVLKRLGDLPYVPSLVHQTPNALYTRYIKGRLLPEAIGSLGFSACLKVGWQILVIVAGIHKMGVVHSDIRPWNFIYGDDAHLCLIDFEYAYAREKTDVTEVLRSHHGSRLKPALRDWSDALKSVGNVWQASHHPVVKFALACFPLAVHWGLRAVIMLQQLGNWGGMFS